MYKTQFIGAFCSARLDRDEQHPIPRRLYVSNGSQQSQRNARRAGENTRIVNPTFLAIILRHESGEAVDPPTGTPHRKRSLKPVTSSLTEYAFARRLKQTVKDVAQTGSAVTKHCILHARALRLARGCAPCNTECLAFPLRLIHTPRRREQRRRDSGVTVTPRQPAFTLLDARARTV